jgi:hypothetical protein
MFVVKWPIRPSVRMKQLTPHWTDFHEILHLSIFKKSVQKIHVWLKSDNNNGYITWRPIQIFNHISLLFLEWKMFQTNVGVKIKKHILRSIPFFYRALYNILKNTVEPDRSQITWHMRLTCWISEATNIHLEYVIIVFPPQQWFPEPTSMLCYT